MTHKFDRDRRWRTSFPVESPKCRKTSEEKQELRPQKDPHETWDRIVTKTTRTKTILNKTSILSQFE